MSLPNVALQHRLNHLTPVHQLGRLALWPATNDDEQLGQLETNRALKVNRNFKVLSQFEEVSPPTRTTAPYDEPSRPSAAARLQKQWLLKTFPEVIAGVAVTAANLADEIKQAKSTVSDSASTSALLAVGEIADKTDSNNIVGRPALATAAGEGGHILHIVTLIQEESGWPEKSLSLRLPKLSSVERGEWVEDGVPISKIKSVQDQGKYGPIRWIIVQKSTGTTVFEPELRLMPFQGNVSELEMNHLRPGAPSHIFANPLFTIKVCQTGGGHHQDVSFNPATEGRFPQLAIIDKAGQWSVWEVTGSRSARPKNLVPIVSARGKVDSSPSPSLKLPGHRDSSSDRLLWILPNDQGRRERREEKNDHHFAFDHLYQTSYERSGHLLISTDVDVLLYDVKQDVQLSRLKIARPKRAETILNLKSCPFTQSQAFVLTTTSLYWIEVVESKKQPPRLRVLLSCDHNRIISSGDVKVNVTYLKGSSGSRPRCAVFLHSPEEKEADVFFFPEPLVGETPQVFHQVFRLDLTSGLISTLISALPLSPRETAGNSATQDENSIQDAENIRVFQLLGLKADLSLGSALFALSDVALQDFGAPSVRDGKKRPDSRRKKYLRHMGSAFVVPDQHEERAGHSQSDTEKARPNSYPDREKVSKKKDVVNLERVCERLNELAAARAASDEIAGEPLGTLVHRRGMEQLEGSDHMRVQTLAELLGDKLGSVDVNTMEEQWTKFREEIKSSLEDRVQISNLGGTHLPADLQSLAAELSEMSFATDDTPESYRDHERHILRQIAAEQYLSLFTMSVAPPAPVPDSPPYLAPSSQTQLTDDETLPRESSPPVPSSQYRSTPAMDIDSDSLPTLDRPRRSLPDEGPLSRLRQYVSIPSSPNPSISDRSTIRLLSHWPREPSDPLSYTHKFASDSSEDERAENRQRREEARKKRRAKRLSLLGLPDREDDEPALSVPRVHHSSQPRFAQASQPRVAQSSQPRVAQSSQPRVAQSSQPRVAQSSQIRGEESQLQGSQRPRIAMSQTVAGPFGSRPLPGKKKKKDRSGFR